MLLKGEDITGVPPYKRPVNTVFQKYALFPHLNVFENVAFGLRLKKMDEETIRRKVRDMLEVVGLKGFERRSIGQMSGGQQQRVAIARSLVNEPEILLLDEPLGALDLKLRKEMQLELKRLQREMNITFIYVTHDQEEAMTMAGRIAIMNRGKFVQIGEPEEIYEHPTTRYSAEFIGSVNVFEGLLKIVRRMAWSLNRRVCSIRSRSILTAPWWTTCRSTSRCVRRRSCSVTIRQPMAITSPWVKWCTLLTWAICLSITCV